MMMHFQAAGHVSGPFRALAIALAGPLTAATLALSCTRQEIEDPVLPEPITEAAFYARIEAPVTDATAETDAAAAPDTRVYADENLHLRWNAGDRISLFNGTSANAAYVFTGHTGDSSGAFDPVPGDAPAAGSPIDGIIALSPYQADASLLTAQLLSFTFPGVQSYAANSFGLEANPMVSITQDNQLYFKNIGAYLVFRLYGEASIRSLTLKGNAGEALCGPAYAIISESEAPSVMLSGETAAEITLWCESPVTLGKTAQTATDFWFVVPPQTLSQGFTLSGRTADGKGFEQRYDKSLSLSRNYRTRMAPLKVEAGDVPDDGLSEALIPALSVQASQTSIYEGAAANLIDGDYQTYYHSPYEVKTQFPLVWEFSFDGTATLDHVSLMHRASGDTPGAHWRGQIGRFTIACKRAGESDFGPAQAFDFGGLGGYQTALLTAPVAKLSAVRIEILDGDPYASYYSEDPYICCAEVEFYSSNREAINALIGRVFTDLSCSELRDGVTDSDIAALGAVSPVLAEKVALPLRDGSYDANEKDFRIHSYEPYSDSHVNRDLCTYLYTSMNNPTGIAVEAGEELLVCVDRIPDGQQVSLAVYDTEGDGKEPAFGGVSEIEQISQTSALQAGINRVPITSSGMLYLMNLVPESNRKAMSEFSPVRVHILPGSGTVLGYFDLARHSDARYSELIAGYSGKFFMVKGAKAMFLFHTDRLRQAAPDAIRSGIETWDEIIGYEHELLGLDACPWFNNHILAVSTTASIHMDAANRRVRFHVDVLPQLCSREALLQADGAGKCNIWGPAHEMGHVNQMAINWRSTTESSNNLFANYALLGVGGDAYGTTYWSQGGKIEQLADSYVEHRPWVLLGDNTAYQGEDSSLHMRMNWQLWIYFHKCGVKPDFFPALFAYFRNGHQLPNEAGGYYGRDEDAGLSQLEYYEACCTVSGQDLTEFFDAWGFFVPVDESYSQYGTTQYTVTEAMVAAAKARVSAMSLPKAAPIQYIEDRTNFGGKYYYSDFGFYTLFRDGTRISGTPSGMDFGGGLVFLSGCDGAVAVELREGTESTGQLLFFTNYSSFELPSSLSLSGNRLWAVQADGERIPIPVS